MDQTLTAETGRTAGSRSPSRLRADGLVPAVVGLVRGGGFEAAIVAGGIVHEDDRQPRLDAGVAAVYTPKDFELVRIMGEIVDLAVAHRGE